MTDFDEVYQKYFNDVFFYIWRLSGNQHTAEEITSETFFKAMNAIDHFRGDCDIRVWLCQIAKNCYFSHRKRAERAGRVEELASRSTADPSASIEDQLTRRDEAMRIQKLLHKIPDPYKEVFMWRTFAELSFKQIAQIYGKSANWACVTYYRGKQMIKDGLEEMEHDK